MMQRDQPNHASGPAAGGPTLRKPSGLLNADVAVPVVSPSEFVGFSPDAEFEVCASCGEPCDELEAVMDGYDWFLLQQAGVDRQGAYCPVCWDRFDEAVSKRLDGRW